MNSTDPCLLATTGATATPLWVAVAVLLLLGTVALAIRFRRDSADGRRRAALLSVAAMALVACVSLTPLTQAPAAQASTPQSQCSEPATTPTPSVPPIPPTEEPAGDDDDEITPPVTVVEPLAPTLTVVPCGETPAVIIPDISGVVYEQFQIGDVVTVTATAASGFVFASGTTTSWDLTVTVVPCPCVPDEIIWPEDTALNPYVLWDGTLTAYLTTWAQALQDQGATFSVHVTDTSHVEIRWTAENGVPAGVDDAPVIFDGVIETNGDTGQLVDGNLQFAVTSTGKSAQTLLDETWTALNEQYPDAGIYYEVLYYAPNVIDGAITASITDSCGTVQTREFAIAPGGGGGNN